MAYYLYAIPRVLLSHCSVGRLDFQARAIFVVVCLLETVKLSCAPTLPLLQY
jgi:hypothetical protein